MKISDVPLEVVENKIYLIRGRKVMFDKDLAQLYMVTTGNLNKAVSRNKERFPDDFAFRLSDKEFQSLIFQTGISRWGGSRKVPYVFTEQGIAMLSSVLRTKRAIGVNIQIMRTFLKLRELILSHKDFSIKIDALERQVGDHDKKIVLIFEAIKQLLAEKEEPPKPKIPYGFHMPIKK